MRKIMLIGLFVLTANSWVWAGQSESGSAVIHSSVKQSDTRVDNAYMNLLVILGRKFELDQIKALYQAQDAWQTYRDKSCQYVDSDFVHPETALDECRVRFNDERIKQLAKYTSQALAH